MTMNIGTIIGAILMLIISVVLVCAIAVQNPKTDGMSAFTGGNTFANANDRSMNGMLNKLVKLFVIGFFVLTLIVYIFAK